MKYNRILISGILSLSVVLLSGCQSASDNKPIVDTQVTDYSKASCEYKPNEGDVAAASVPEVKLQTGAFGKRYDRSLLESVLTASSMETVRFAQMTDVTFYSVVQHKSNSCLMASFIPEATSFYEEKFLSLGDDVLGLYLSPKNRIVGGKNERPVILVRRDANRWVIVHEYMHHLFSKEAPENDRSDDEVINDVTSSAKPFVQAQKSYNNSKSIANLKVLLGYAKKLSVSYPELLKRFTLEEMAIESVLSKALENGQFRNVPVNQAINGAAYTVQSGKKALKDLQFIEEVNELGRSLIVDTLAIVNLTLEERTELKKIFDDSSLKVVSYKSELHTLKAAAETRLRQEGYDPGRLSGFVAARYSREKSEENHVGCAHGKVIEPILNNIGEMLHPKSK